MKKFLVSLRKPKSFRLQVKPVLFTIEEAQSIVVLAELVRADQQEWIASFTKSMLDFNPNIQLVVLCKSRKLTLPETNAKLVRIDRKDFLWTGTLSADKQSELPAKANLLINISRQDDPYALHIMSGIGSDLNISINGHNLLHSGHYELNFDTVNKDNPGLLVSEIASYLNTLKGKRK